MGRPDGECGVLDVLVPRSGSRGGLVKVPLLPLTTFDAGIVMGQEIVTTLESPSSTERVQHHWWEHRKLFR